MAAPTSIVPRSCPDGILGRMDDLSQAAGLDFGAILDAAPDGMVLVETDGRILLANQEMEALFGYSRAELVGQPVEMLVPRESRQGHPTLRDGYMQESRARGMAGGRILSGVCKDGTRLPVSISLSVIDAGGKQVVLATVRDLTVQAGRPPNFAAVTWNRPCCCGQPRLPPRPRPWTTPCGV